MEDLLSQGKDHEPSPWPPRLLVIAILVLVAVAVVRHLPGGRVAPPDHPAASVSAGPVQLAGLGRGAAGLLDHADGVVRSNLPPRLRSSASCHPRAARLDMAGQLQCGPNRPRVP
jgi:hypothetical protein